MGSTLCSVCKPDLEENQEYKQNIVDPWKSLLGLNFALSPSRAPREGLECGRVLCGVVEGKRAQRDERKTESQKRLSKSLKLTPSLEQDSQRLPPAPGRKRPLPEGAAARHSVVCMVPPVSLWDGG
ncbi:hypothetical protein H920_13549 [Fukomys damarensis]|uniref:Uncharacterized protein n=1 Tax=Fukomys damarensis TaxID=885580 RepID=A0A091D3G2_FUKDA|nr:hypothetical protein H920_13549 [Fukomys damarensis]